MPSKEYCTPMIVKCASATPIGTLTEPTPEPKSSSQKSSQFGYYPDDMRRLWRGVLLRALADGVGGSAQERLEVVNWLQDTDDTGDFDQVCQMAGADANFLGQEILEIMALPKAQAVLRAAQARDALESDYAPKK